MNPQQEPSKPVHEGRPLRSLRDLEYRLNEDRRVLQELAEHWKDQYSPFQQPKKPKPHQRGAKSSKLREIDNPGKALKRVQKKILNRLLKPLELPHFLFGAVPGRCIKMHAREHLGSKTVVMMDIKNYYPNIKCRHIYRVFRHVLLCSPRIARILTQLTTYDWHLPQGAPTSPALANLFLASIYGPVLEACADKKIVVTAWVDDLAFSGDDARSVMELVRQTLAENGFKLAPQKRLILNPRTAKLITGVRLGASQLRASKKKLHEIRAGIHNLRVGRFTERGRSADIRSLEGQIMHIKSICPADAVRLEATLKLAVAARGQHSTSHQQRLLSQQSGNVLSARTSQNHSDDPW